MREVLFFSIHHPDLCIPQTASLVRRVGQYEQYFKEKGFEVQYITVNDKNFLNKKKPNNLILNIPLIPYFKNKYINKIFVLIITYLFGDIYGYSLFKKRKQIFNRISPSTKLCISFFTPRGMIGIGAWVKKRFNVLWVVDLQDSLDEGLSSNNYKIGFSFLRKNLKFADEIIHVSPEWATLDSKRIGKKISVFRHVIPNNNFQNLEKSNLFFDLNKTSIVYAGNIHFDQMKVQLLNVLKEFKNINFYYAGNQEVSQELQKRGVSNTHVGYLNFSELNSFYTQSDIIVVFAWYSSDRKVIPSKFYEACSFKKPILIIGPDSGAFSILFEDWGHPNVVCDTTSKIREALIGFEKNDLSNFFILENCASPGSTLSSFYNFLDLKLLTII